MFFQLIGQGNVPIRSGGRDHNAQSLDNPEVFQRAAAEGLLTRIMPSFRPSEQARQFVGLTCAELARICLQRAGINTSGLSPATLVTRALNTTSDFTGLLVDTGNRVLRDAYTAAASGIRQLAKETTVPDFRAKSSIMLDASGFILEAVTEAGEFRHGHDDRGQGKLLGPDLRQDIRHQPAGDR